MHRPARAGLGRPALDPGAPVLEAQRAALRRPAGQGQEVHPADVRRRAVHAVAPLLRHAAAADQRRQRVLPGRRPALRRPRRRRSEDGVPGRRRRPAGAVPLRRDRRRPEGRQGRDGRRARQLAARGGQAARRGQRRRHRRAQHPHRHPAALRARRRPEADHPRWRVPRSRRPPRTPSPRSPTRVADRPPRCTPPVARSGRPGASSWVEQAVVRHCVMRCVRSVHPGVTPGRPWFLRSRDEHRRGHRDRRRRRARRVAGRRAGAAAPPGRAAGAGGRG